MFHFLPFFPVSFLFPSLSFLSSVSFLVPRFNLFIIFPFLLVFISLAPLVSFVLPFLLPSSSFSFFILLLFMFVCLFVCLFVCRFTLSSFQNEVKPCNQTTFPFVSTPERGFHNGELARSWSERFTVVRTESVQCKLT